MKLNPEQPLNAFGLRYDKSHDSTRWTQLKTFGDDFGFFGSDKYYNMSVAKSTKISVADKY